jgi:hypothetical protein
MIAIGYPNLITTATTVSGGSWRSALPLSNIRTRDYAQVARSTDAAHGSTQIRIDHGATVTAQVLYLDGHNLSAGAQVRWSRGTTLGGAEVAQIGLRDAWQITPLVRDGRDHGVMMLLPQATTARYDLIEIQDASNAAGYVDIARVAIAPLITPTYGPSYGLQDRLSPLSSVERATGGALWLQRRRVLREVSLVLPALALSSGDELHELQRAADITDEVVYIPDTGDTAAQQRYGMLGTLAELSPVEYPYYRTRKLPLRITQAA